MHEKGRKDAAATMTPTSARRPMLNITDTIDENTDRVNRYLSDEQGYEIYTDMIYYIYYVTYERRIGAVTENVEMAKAARDAQIERDRRDNTF